MVRYAFCVVISEFCVLNPELVVPAQAATYYISKSLGSDSNTSTQAQARMTPWAHLPGMQSCTSNCASYTPQPGDQFILLGGDTWGASDLGVSWIWTGTSSSPIYIGVDPTWSLGSSWSRPIWSCGGTACVGTGGAASYLSIGNGGADNMYLTVDNLEVTGLYSNATSQPNYFSIWGQNVTLEHIYAHGWSHDTAASGTPDNSFVFSFNGGYNTSGGVVHDSVVDGSDTSEDSMGCFTDSLSTAYNNICQYVTNGFEGAGSDIHDNWFGPIVPCFVTGGCHQNALFQFGPDNSATREFVYNNVITGTTWSGGVVKLWLSGNDPNTATGYAFNNVIYNNAPGNDFNTAGHFDANYGTWYFFNNTLELGMDSSTEGGICYGDAAALAQGDYAPGEQFVFHSQNNHWVGCSSGVQCVQFTCTETTDIIQSVATANGQGYVSTGTYAFAPTNSSGSTVGAGTNAQSLCATIAALNSAAGTACQSDTGYACTYNTTNHTVSCPARTTVARPATWDAGAYQYCPPGQCTQVPPPPSTNTSSFAPHVYPNPWRSDRGYPAQITFDQLGGNTTIKIFTASAHLVKTLTTSNVSVIWDLTNDSGSTVASGIYIYLITDSQGDKVKGKVAVIK